MVGVTSALYLEVELRETLEASIESELHTLARSIRGAARPAPRASPPEADAFADRLGEATGHRVSVIDRDGRVVGDSGVALARLASLDSHAGRPEVLAALADGVGVARRRSRTMSVELLYVAIPFEGGVIRVATPLSEVDHAVARMRWLLTVAGLFGLVLAVFMSGLASHMLSRRLKSLLDSARLLAERHGAALPTPGRGDEIGRLANSFNHLGAALQEVVTELAEERDRFETVLDGMSEAVIAVDGEGRIDLVNRAGMQLLGATSPLGGRPVEEVVDAAELRALLELPCEDGPVIREIERPDGRSMMGHVTPDPLGEGAVFVLHDVTRLRQLETIRRDFVANVSHELRTPVTVIRANAETLLEGALDDPKRARTFVEALARNAERLTDLISDLLDIARLESGSFALEPARVPVAHIATHAVEAVRAHAQTEAEVACHVPEALAVRADERALEQILVNLVENAVKYVGTGGHVEVAAVAASDTVRIEVRDDGPGIPEEHRDRIFERFYRMDGGRSKAMGGTGLGLSIVKHLVVAMDGRVGVEANGRRGAVFWVELPAA